jgi:phosphoribosyl-dephospho-CoA transferase
MEEILTGGSSTRSEGFLAHDLLKIREIGDLQIPRPLPSWVETSLELVPWVVVRRCLSHQGMIPVGIRGNSREQRFAAFLPPEAILVRVTPEQLVSRFHAIDPARSRLIAALQHVDSVNRILSGIGWGPTGSIGFEIATGFPCARTDSDLDILIRVAREFDQDLLRRVGLELFARGPVRMDVLVETRGGAFALSEWMRGERPILLRSLTGPKLVNAV